MKTIIKFGKWEMSAILINAMSTKVFLNFPRTALEVGGTAGWILILYVTLLSIIGFLIIYMLYKRFNGKDLIDISEYLAGSVGRIISGLIIITVLTLMIIVILREFSEDMKTITLISSPLSFVMIFFAAAMAVGAYFGIEAIARCHVIIVPIIVAAYFLIIVGVLPQSDFSQIFPLLGSGTDKIFLQGTVRMSFFAELLILFLLTSFAKDNKTVKKAGIISLTATGLFFLMVVIVYISLFPYPSDLENFLPLYQIARLIDYGRFLQRVESIFVLIWSSAAFLFLSVSFYLLIHIFTKTFRIKHYKPLILPFTAIIYALSFIPDGLPEIVQIDAYFVHKYFFIVTFIFTILLYAAANIKSAGRRRDTSDA